MLQEYIRHLLWYFDVNKAKIQNKQLTKFIIYTRGDMDMKKMLSVLLCMLLIVVSASGCVMGVKNQSVDKSQIKADTANFIGEDRAKEIALEKAGISSDGVVFDRIELDYDDGRWEYEVEFRKDRTEYDVVIGAEQGDVISFESDPDD